MKKWIVLSVATFALSFLATMAWKLGPELTRPKYIDPAFRIPSALELAAIPTATHFDFPLGNENGAMAYNAQHFTENKHLGDDLNGIGGENSDLGDPIYAMAAQAGATLSFCSMRISKMATGNMCSRTTDMCKTCSSVRARS
jgi:hypothetical protein